jgi:hypothetical protein
MIFEIMTHLKDFFKDFLLLSINTKVCCLKCISSKTKKKYSPYSDCESIVINQPEKSLFHKLYPFNF